MGMRVKERKGKRGSESERDRKVGKDREEL